MKKNLNAIIPIIILLVSCFVIPSFFICGPVPYIVAAVLSLIFLLLLSDIRADKPSFSTWIGLFATIAICVIMMIKSPSNENDLVAITETHVMDATMWISPGVLEEYGYSKNFTVIDTTHQNITLYGRFYFDYHKTRENREHLTRRIVPTTDDYVTYLFEKIRNSECTNPNLRLSEKKKYGTLTFKGEWAENVSR